MQVLVLLGYRQVDMVPPSTQNPRLPALQSGNRTFQFRVLLGCPQECISSLVSVLKEQKIRMLNDVEVMVSKRSPSSGWRGERGAPPRAAGDPTPGGGASTVGLFATKGLKYIAPSKLAHNSPA